MPPGRRAAKQTRRPSPARPSHRRIRTAPIEELARITLAAHGDHRTVVTDDNAGMFAPAPGDALMAKDGTVIAKTSYREWLAG